MVSRQQVIEQYYFEQFRTHYEVPTGEITYDDKPDVRIASNALGIEIVRLFIKDGRDCSSEQVQTIRRENVLARAQQMHSKAGGRAIELHVDFEPGQPITNVEAKALQLCRLVAKNQNAPCTLVCNLDDEAEGLRFIYHNGVEYPDAKWRVTQVFDVPEVDICRLESVVAEKNAKSKGYLPCDEYWLLVVVDFRDPAQDQDIQLPPDYLLPQSAFERILIYKPQLGQVVEIPHA